MRCGVVADVVSGALYEFNGIALYDAITDDPSYYLYRNELTLL